MTEKNGGTNGHYHGDSYLTDNFRLSLLPPRLTDKKDSFGESLPNNCTYVEIDYSDKYFGLISDYIATCGKVSNWNLKYNYQEDEDEDEKEKSKKQEESLHVILSLGQGVHVVEYEGDKIFAINQSIGDPVSSGMGYPSLFKMIILFMEGMGKEKIIAKFCDYVYRGSLKSKKNYFKLYCWDLHNQYWRKLTEKTIRSLDSIVLPSSVKEELVNDLGEFTSKETSNWYHKHGIPYKRSYLFYGPPGSGKSSFIHAMAGIVKRNVYYLQPAHPLFTDDMLRNSIIHAEKNSIIVMEDIDALFDENRNSKSEKCPLTFSGLLNALDGLTNIDGHIFVLTTNYIERLDPALIRDGRVDYRIEFPNATREQVVDMFLKFYPNEFDYAKNLGIRLLKF